MAARNVIHWDRVRGFKGVLTVLTATALGAGLVPKAPGTMGTLIAVPLAVATRNWTLLPRIALWLLITGLGTWGARAFDSLMRTGDNQCIVIDEVVGLGITSWTLSGAGSSVAGWCMAFVLFRFFDILKLPPVRQVDQWSKKKSLENTPLASWWGGFGVMADDILAGVQGLIIMILLQHYGLLSH